MVPVKKVATPGSYKLAKTSKQKEKDKQRKDKEKKRRRKGKGKQKGRPSLNVKKASTRTGPRTKYPPENLQRAYDLVKEEGWTAFRAAKECGVPRITLVDKLQGTHKTGQVGRPTVLNKVEEEVLVEVLVLMGQYNYPVTKRHLRDMVKSYLDKHRDTRWVTKGSHPPPPSKLTWPFFFCFYSLSLFFQLCPMYQVQGEQAWQALGGGLLEEA
jgi:hypothetical protein